MYLRELPEPLMTYDMYEAFIAAEGIEDLDNRLQCIQQLVESLPPCNYSILSLLMKLLHKVSEHYVENKMTTSNLAIVIAPNILRPEQQTMESIINDTPHVTAVIETLISDYEFMFRKSISEGNIGEKPVRFD